MTEDRSTNDLALLEVLLSRRSVRPKRLTAPGPGAEDLTQIVRAGLRGIDHGGHRRWRLLLINDREALADAFVETEQGQSNPERARERALAGPTLVAVIARQDVPNMDFPTHEKWIAIGAALQQMLLAAQAIGFAGSMLSGRKTEAASLRRALGIEEGEVLVGFLTFGTLSTPPPPLKKVDDPQDFWSLWPPSSPSQARPKSG